MSDINPDLKVLHKLLTELFHILIDKKNASSDPDVRRAINGEIDEVVFRITTVQRELFKAQTAKIAAAVAKVSEAKGDLDAAIAEIEKLNKFLRTISTFLGLVDKVIDLVKLV